MGPKKKALFIGFLSLMLLLAGPLARSGEAKHLSEDEQLIRVGTGAYRDGFYDVAETQFLHFVKVYPAHIKVYDVCYLLGKTLLAKGNLKDAKKYFLKIIYEHKAFDEMAYALFWTAVIETRLGNPEEAKKILVILTQKFPKFEWSDYSSYLLGLLDFGAGRLSSAEASLKSVGSSSRREDLVGSSVFWLGVIAYRRRDYDGSIRHFQNFVKGARSASQEYLRDSLFWLAEAQIRLIRFQDAKANYRMYYDQFKQGPLLPEALWRLAYCDYRLGNLPQAIEILQAVKAQYKDSKVLVYTHYLLGEIFLRQDDFSSCLKEFNSILNLPQAQALWGAALMTQYWCHLCLGSPGEADKVSQKLAKLNSFEEEKTFIEWLNAEMGFSEGRVSDIRPYYFNLINTRFRERALFQIGRGYFYEDNFRESVTNLDILSLEFPSSKYRDESLFMKGESQLHLGDMEHALETFTHISLQNRTIPWGLFALTQMGTIHLLRNDYDHAEKAFRAITAEFPNHPLFYYASFQLGNVQFQRRNIAEATSYYSVVLKGNILDLVGEVYFRFGEIFYRQEKYDHAFKNFETAMRYFKENSLGFFLSQLEMGNIQRRWDKVEEAKRSYQNIVDHSQDEEVRNAAKELLMRLTAPRFSAT